LPVSLPYHHLTGRRPKKGGKVPLCRYRSIEEGENLSCYFPYFWGIRRERGSRLGEKKKGEGFISCPTPTKKGTCHQGEESCVLLLSYPGRNKTKSEEGEEKGGKLDSTSTGGRAVRKRKIVIHLFSNHVGTQGGEAVGEEGASLLFAS